MADILIRGMEEPPRCSACRMVEGNTDDGFCHVADKWFDDEYFSWYQYPDGDIATDKPLNCPLVPLPEGHGRLIDADALMEIIRAHDYPLTAHFNSTDNGMFTLGIQQAVDEVTIIVPAEGRTEYDGNA